MIEKTEKILTSFKLNKINIDNFKDLSTIMLLLSGLSFIFAFSFYTGLFFEQHIPIMMIGNIPINILFMQVFSIFLILILEFLILYCGKKVWEKDNKIRFLLGYLYVFLILNILISLIVCAFLIGNIELYTFIFLSISFLIFNILWGLTWFFVKVIGFLYNSTSNLIKKIFKFETNDTSNEERETDGLDILVYCSFYIIIFIGIFFSIGFFVKNISAISENKFIIENKNDDNGLMQKIIFQYNEKAIVNDCQVDKKTNEISCDKSYNYITDLTDKKIYYKNNTILKKE